MNDVMNHPSRAFERRLHVHDRDRSMRKQTSQSVERLSSSRHASSRRRVAISRAIHASQKFARFRSVRAGRRLERDSVTSQDPSHRWDVCAHRHTSNAGPCRTSVVYTTGTPSSHTRDDGPPAVRVPTESLSEYTYSIRIQGPYYTTVSHNESPIIGGGASTRGVDMGACRAADSYTVYPHTQAFDRARRATHAGHVRGLGGGGDESGLV
jgi:hypothetical protein